ncbi:hypothetical protein KAFR_0D02120 [Kazachstania africana CBS 2517]|uniref:FH2 domain-containing protein n=1 Tax=Kazachstania africana (strain ATCC 22294 / BCRC 22015 / CBS 2517 / CECT 1963 / NBRC 1671 / NRRL Y-8276) TaxID=1071382 RepID=H2AU09_KAZAF|nr:hypothetical protein KAFR_0D02120 [Kazachstania africana CBS 2517]CCF57859.1 hypothetical protein KAFR_0D02120 [Kazachstania africana CBS 2517]
MPDSSKPSNAWITPHNYQKRSVSLEEATNPNLLLSRSTDDLISTGLSLAGIGLKKNEGPLKRTRYSFKMKSKNRSESDISGPESTVLNSKFNIMSMPDEKTVNMLFSEMLEDGTFFWGSAQGNLQKVSSKRKWELICKIKSVPDTTDNEKEKKESKFFSNLDNFPIKDPDISRSLYQIEKVLRQSQMCDKFVKENHIQMLLDIIPSISSSFQYVYLQCFKTLLNNAEARAQIIKSNTVLQYFIDLMINEGTSLRTKLQSSQLLLLLTYVDAEMGYKVIWSNLEKKLQLWLNDLNEIILNPDSIIKEEKSAQFYIQLLRPKQLITEYLSSCMFLINSIIEGFPLQNEKYSVLEKLKDVELPKLFFELSALDSKVIQEQIYRYKKNDENIRLKIINENPLSIPDISYGATLMLLIEKSKSTPLEEPIGALLDSVLKILDTRTYSESIKLFASVSSLLTYLVDKLDSTISSAENANSLKPVLQDSIERLIDNLESDEVARRAMKELRESETVIKDLNTEIHNLKREKNSSKEDILEQLEEVSTILDEKETEIENLTLNVNKLEELLREEKKKNQHFIAHQQFNEPTKSKFSLFNNLGGSTANQRTLKRANSTSIFKSKRVASLSSYLQKASETELSNGPTDDTSSISMSPTGDFLPLRTIPPKDISLMNKKGIKLIESSPRSITTIGEPEFLKKMDTPLNSTLPENLKSKALHLDFAGDSSLSLRSTLPSSPSQPHSTKIDTPTTPLASSKDVPVAPPPPAFLQSTTKSISPTLLVPTPPPPPPPPPLFLTINQNTTSKSSKETSLTAVSPVANSNDPQIPMPPPPPPLPMTFNAASNNLITEPNVEIVKSEEIRLKQIHWEKVEDIESTLWHDSARREETAKELKLDGIFDQVMDTFQVKNIKMKKRDTTTASKKQNGTLLPRNLAQQFGINLHMFSSLGTDEFVEKVLECNSDIVSNVSVLEFFNKEELTSIPTSLIQKFTPYAENIKSKFELERADRIFFELCFQLHSYWRERSNCLLILNTYEKDYYDLMYKLKKVDDGIQRLLSSSKFRDFLYIIIEIGNYMNKKTVNGIRIGSLNKLVFVKSSLDNNVSFLHFIEKIIRVKYPDIYSFINELRIIQDLGKLSIDQLEYDSQEFCSKINKMSNDLEKGKLSKADRIDPRDQLLKKTKYKVLRAKSKSELMRHQLKLLGHDYAKIMRYFGEDASDRDSKNAFFTNIFEFIQVFKKCSKENIEKEEMERVYEQRQKMFDMRKKEEEEQTQEKEQNDENRSIVDALIMQLRVVEKPNEPLRDRRKTKITGNSHTNNTNEQLLERTQAMLQDIQNI